MHVQSNVMSQPVDKIFAQRITMQVFSMRVDVVIGHFVERVTVRAAFQFRFPRLKCLDGCFLRAENDVVNLALTGSELAVDRRCARMSVAYMENSPPTSITTTSPSFMMWSSSE